MAYTKTKSKSSSSEEKKQVKDIIVERLLAKIELEGRLPWQKPFIGASMNWYTKYEYKGSNKILLSGGEYITVRQLKMYNESKKSTFWFKKGTPCEYVVYYSRTEKKVTEEEMNKNRTKDGYNVQYTKKDDGFYRISWVLKYTKVYNISFIQDKEGNTLPTKLGDSVIETHIPADEIISRYQEFSGVGLHHGSSGAYYTEGDDSVHLPFKPNFDSTEAYYRVLFHEMIHSTGVHHRLDRACFKKYHQGSRERSKEELVAEVGSLLLASEAGFTIDSPLADNSENYVQGWCNWMKTNPKEVIDGMSAANRAMEYILTGGAGDLHSTSSSIDDQTK